MIFNKTSCVTEEGIIVYGEELSHEVATYEQIKSLDGNTSPEKIKELQELLTGKMGIGRNSDKFTQLENKMKDMVSNY